MPYAQVEPEEIDFAGGVDLVTPALAIAPGCLIASQNFEPNLNGGYRRMYGCERFDGQASPSAQTYWLGECTLTRTPAVGATITGQTSGATAIVLQVNGTTELVLTAVSGTFVAETITVSASSIGTIASNNMTAAVTPALDAAYTRLAANYYRTLIAAVPGSGAVLGVKYYNGAVYAFRNNVGGTAAVMWKSTGSGWTQVTFGYKMPLAQRSGAVTVTSASPGVVTFTAHGAANGTPVVFGGTAVPGGLTAGTVYYVVASTTNTFEVAATPGGSAITTSSTGTSVTATFNCTITPAVGDTITGNSSGATAVAVGVLLRTGTWASAPIGTLVFATISGVFTNGEALLDTTQSNALIGQATAAASAITLQPGGRFEFDVGNFSGQAATRKLYGCDGVNTCWEFDGTTFLPITTGIGSDNPMFIAVWMNMLVVALGSSIEVSGIGQPYSWTALTGAAEITTGDVITGILPQVPNQTSGALAVFTKNKTYMLYGTSVADFNFVTQSPDAGALPYSMQNIGFAYFMNTKGAMQINTTKNYGNFVMSVLTRKIQPFVDKKRGQVMASCIVRASNQYRIYYADGTGFLLYMTPQNTETIGGDVLLGDVVGGAMTFDYSGLGTTFNTITSDVDTSGIERTFAAGANGYVYELERGTSLDGNAIFAYMITAFNSSKSPRNRKHYIRTTLNVLCGNVADVTVGYSLSFGGLEAQDGRQSTQTMIGNSQWWDIFTFDSFVWDAPYVSEYTLDTPGNGRNLALIIYGNTDLDLPYTIQSAIPNYTVGRLERG